MIELTTQFTTINCRCGGVYALPEVYVNKKHEVGESWNCPFCQVGWGYAGHGRLAGLERQIAGFERQLTRERAQHDQTRAARIHAENRRRAEKGAKTRLKKRIANGVCACCGRSFENLRRHMATKHPDFVKD